MEDGFWASVIHPDDRETTVRTFLREVAAGRDHELEYRVLAADGSTVWVRNIVQVRGDGAAAGRLRGIMLDVTERVRQLQRRAAEHATTKVLAEADGLVEATPRLLEGICRALHWQAGELWVVDDRTGVLRFVELWHTPDLDLRSLEVWNTAATFGPGEGLLGRVWTDAEPYWVADLATDANVQRVGEVTQAGLRSAFAFPIARGRRVLGVLAFYTREQLEPDTDLLQTMADAGSQIGQFVERKRAEGSLRDSEARKSAILEAAIDGIFKVDDQGSLIELNPAAERIFGATRSEAIGRKLTEVVSGLPRFWEDATGPPPETRSELSVIRADGTSFLCELTITKVRLAGSTLYTGFVRDITERTRLDEEVRFQKALLQSQSEAGIDGILVLAEDGRILYWNRQLAEIWGVGEDVFASGRAQSAIWPLLEQLEDPEAFLADAERMFEATGSSRTEVRLKGGRVLDRWTAPLSDPPGARAWYYRDITRYKQTETALRESEERTAFFAEVGEMLAASLDPRATLERLAVLTVPRLADVCVIDLVSPTRMIDRTAIAFNDPDRGPRVVELEERFPLDPDGQFGVAKVLRTGEPELYAEVTDAMLRAHSASDEQLRQMREFGARSAVCVPMIARGRVVGVISLVSSQPGRTYDASSLRVAVELARRAAVAVDNAAMFQERTRIAATLQQGLLPSVLPEIPGLEIAAGFHPEGDGTEVGGDFYDVFDVGGRWGISLGDVCGKGASAAVMTTLARYTIRAAAPMHGRPSVVLQMLNDAIYREQVDDRFCTAVYGFVETNRSGVRVRISCGGHPGPYVLRRKGAVEKIACQGTVLGVFPDPDLRDLTVDLGKGDAMVFYTDGVPEARAASSAFGEGMLRSLIGSLKGSSANEIAERIVRTVVGFQKGYPQDDIAVLVLRAPD